MYIHIMQHTYMHTYTVYMYVWVCVILHTLLLHSITLTWQSIKYTCAHLHFSKSILDKAENFFKVVYVPELFESGFDAK